MSQLLKWYGLMGVGLVGLPTVAGSSGGGLPRASREKIGGTLSFLGDKFAKVRTSVSSFFCWREKAEISRLWCRTQPSISGLNKIHFIFVFLRASVLPRPEFLFFCANSGHWPDSCGKIRTSVSSIFLLERES